MKRSKVVPRILFIICLSVFIYILMPLSLDDLVNEFTRIVLMVSSFAYQFLEDNHIVIIVAFFALGWWFFSLLMQKFNFVVSENARFKLYFISKYNILTSKIRRVQEIDLPKDLLFKKLIEILPRAGFIIKQSDEKHGTIHAITPITKMVMGEIIYISLAEVNGKSMLEFYSVSIFSGYNFRHILKERNERNFKKLIQEYEESLII